MYFLLESGAPNAACIYGPCTNFHAILGYRMIKAGMRINRVNKRTLQVKQYDVVEGKTGTLTWKAVNNGR